jgi:phosphocarrier protein
MSQYLPTLGYNVLYKITFGSAMPTRTMKIINKLGIHMKPAGLFVQEAGKYKSDILVYKDDLDNEKVNGKSLIGILMLAAGKDSTITIEADGEDAEQALDGLESLVIQRKFDEE